MTRKNENETRKLKTQKQKSSKKLKPQINQSIRVLNFGLETITDKRSEKEPCTKNNPN